MPLSASSDSGRHGVMPYSFENSYWHLTVIAPRSCSRQSSFSAT